MRSLAGPTPPTDHRWIGTASYYFVSVIGEMQRLKALQCTGQGDTSMKPREDKRRQWLHVDLLPHYQHEHESPSSISIICGVALPLCAPVHSGICRSADGNRTMHHGIVFLHCVCPLEICNDKININFHTISRSGAFFVSFTTMCDHPCVDRMVNYKLLAW